MPWTAKDADKHKKGLKPAQKAQWAKTANGVLKSCQAKGGKDCEGKAIRIANSKFSLADINSTWTLADVDDHDEYFQLKKQTKAVTEARKKPGGSSAGKYKTKGPFCGPSGGAPKGTYPVNTRKRARAAIAYARHAPNPAGIKKCVYRHWPDLKAKKSKSKQSDEEFAMSENNEIPKGALRFVEQGSAHCEFADSGDGNKIAKLKMTAYTGKVIKGHWWWGNLAIDLDGMSFSGKKFPILENHNQDKKIAFTAKPIITDDHALEIDSDKTHFVDTEASQEFQKLSAEGFPYQSSIYAKPTQIQRLMEKEVADINGFKFTGPGTIWRKCEFKEASVCVFGWDSKTTASAFSRTEMEDVDVDVDEFMGLTDDAVDDNGIETKGGDIMDLDQFKTEHSDIAEQFKEEVTQEVTAELKKGFEKEKGVLNEQLSTQSDKIAQLEKNDALRAERELKMQAEAIFDAQLSQSDVSDHLYDKVKVMVRHSKFTKDGVLDVEKFTEAVDAEIKDWEKRGATSQVLGAGRLSKTETGEDEKTQQLADENKKLTNSLLARTGQKIDTDK